LGVGVLAGDLAGGVEVEDVDAMPADAGAVAGVDEPAQRGRDAAAMRAGEVVAADPAQRGLARGLVDEATGVSGTGSSWFFTRRSS